MAGNAALRVRGLVDGNVGRILAALASRYEVVYPAGVRDVTAVEGPVIYRLSR